MLPGQTVNKDVYAVNTGNIEAFVKEDLTGVLDLTFETKKESWDADCVKLTLTQVAAIEGNTTHDGETTYEAGGFLAWTDTSAKTGAFISARGNEDPAVEGRWMPSETGTYIFRRSIKQNDTDPAHDTFEYSGYYYNANSTTPGDGDYYKIIIGSDDYRVNTGTKYEFDVSAPQAKLSDVNGGAVTVDKDGVITADELKVYYVKDTEVKNEKATFKFEPASTTVGSEHNPRLVVSYKLADGVGTGIYDAGAAASRAEVEYYNALGDSNNATVKYNQAKADYEYAKALAEATNALIEAAQTRNSESTANVQKHQAVDDKYGDVKTKASGLVSTFGTLLGLKDVADDAGIASTNLVNGSVRTQINDDTLVVLAESKVQLDKFDKIWSNANPAAGEEYGIKELAKKLNDELIDATTLAKTLATSHGHSDHVTPAALKTALENIEDYISRLDTQLKNYSQAYADLKAASPDTVTSLMTDTTTVKSTIDEYRTNTTYGTEKMAKAVNDSTATDDLADLIALYKVAYEAYAPYAEATGEAASATAWADAITAYNNAVDNAAHASDPDGATKTYNAAVGETEPDPRTPTAVNYVDNGGTIRTNYAAPTSDTDVATIATNTDAATAATWTTKTVPTESNYPTGTGNSVADLKSAMDTALSTMNQKKNAYEDAKKLANNSDTIKIYVNLDEDFANSWYMDPNTDGTEQVDFYLRKILGAGETSKRLVDSIEFDKDVNANMYKNLVFDLNVGLDSVQVTYENDQNTLSTEAVKSDDSFTLKPTLADPTDINTAITWPANP